MKIWVVTGPIGAGKSTVSALLAERGAAVVDADLLGHEVLADPAVRDNLVQEFGPDCMRDGQIDRSWLGALVFSRKRAMERLNALTHPALISLAALRLEKLAKEGHHELAVLEAAVYFLWPPMKMVDMVISVVADPDVRLQRLLTSRDMNPVQARDRLQAQKNMDLLWGTADTVIDNSSHLEALVAVVDELMLNNNL